MSQDVTDYHEFAIWRYQDDSISIRCRREDADVDARTAYMEANVLARCLAENIHGEEQVFSLHAYASGMVSTMWKHDDAFTFEWQRFRWTKMRMNDSLYESLVRSPAPPRWVLWTLIVLEYCAALITRWFKKTSGRDPDETEVLEEDTASPGTVYSENIIPFPGAK